MVAFFFFTNINMEHRLTNANSYSGAGNVTILGKALIGSREESFPQMMTISIIWLILHMLSLTLLMIWVGVMDSSTHLPHWSNHRFVFHGNPKPFFATASGLLLLGPISILFLWRLKLQIKNFGEKEGKVDTFWGAQKTCDLGLVAKDMEAIRRCKFHKRLAHLGEQSNKENWFFLDIVRKGGGGLVESKISLTEKTEIFLDFLAERGGGVSPNPKGF